MRRHTPPTAALQAFEACARHLSVSRAADELHLTQSADGTLTIAVQPTFGTRWLVPRMPRFHAAHRRIVVNYQNYTTRPTPLDFAAEDVDAAIMLDAGPRPGSASHRLVADRRIPVCAPALIMDRRLDVVADLARHTLLQHSTQPRAWTEWLAMVGAIGVDGLRGPKFHHHAMVAAAAVNGLGVALMPAFMVTEELARGSLIAPFEHALDTGAAYVLAYPEASTDMPALRAFRDWLLAEIAGEGESRR